VAIARLRAANAPINEDLDASWSKFYRFRREYRPYIELLEQTTASPSSTFLPRSEIASAETRR
jgi:hypothetical protein